ncbi:MAG: tetratricopeptide repeat protein [Lachnospiraceae bacterium]|nr:tetratricopeptide repeat protein [Lachnospiraceae bacterium]
MGSQDKCPRCGQEVKIYKRIIQLSNSCYNRGLELARVRDMSGALTWLQRSLKWNKNNVPARNLLGLVYYEIGEVEDALEEWTISASFQAVDNPAVGYLETIASRQARVDNISQVIRKYNLAIRYVREESEDLAILQAKQVISRNPRHLKAHLLLALLYMKKKEYAKAERILHKALRIDSGNSTALIYLSELREVARQRRLKSMKRKREILPVHPAEEEDAVAGDILIPKYSERTGSWRTVFLMVTGILIGVVSTYFLIFPAERRDLQQQANQAQQDYFSSLQQLQDEIDRLEHDSADWETEKQALLEQLAAYAGKDTVQAKYDRLLLVYAYKFSGDDYHAMEELLKIDPEGDLSEQFLTGYQKLTAEYSTNGASRLYNTAVTLCEESKFEEARDSLLMVLQWNEEFPEAIFLLGTAYWNLADRENAAVYLNRVITEYPDHLLAKEAKDLLATAN